MGALFSTSQIQNEDYLLNSSVEGLTEKDIKLLKKLSVPHIKIQQTIPFAPFMFFGALIIIIFGIDIISLIYNLISQILI